MTPRLEEAARIFEKHKLPVLAAAAKGLASAVKDDCLLKQLAIFRAEGSGVVTLHLGRRAWNTGVQNPLVQVTMPICEAPILALYAIAVTSFLFVGCFDDIALFILDNRGWALQLFFTTHEDLHWRRLWLIRGSTS